MEDSRTPIDDEEVSGSEESSDSSSEESYPYSEPEDGGCLDCPGCRLQPWIERINANQMDVAELNLREWGLNNNDVARLAQALQGNRTTTSLILRDNAFGCEGATALADLLKVNRTITSVDLSSNHICDVNATRFAEALKVNDAIRRLSFCATDISSAGVIAICEAAQAHGKLEDLVFSCNESVDDDAAAAFARMLASNKHITRVSFSACGIGARGVREIANALKKHEKVENLSLSSVYLNDALLGLADVFKVNKSITQVDFTECGISDFGAVLLADAFKVNSTLTKVYLSGNDIGDGGICKLAEALQENDTIRVLCLDANPFGDVGFASMCRALAQNRALQQLWVGQCGLSAASAAGLGQALQANNTLTTLSLNLNAIGDEGATSLAAALTANKSLRNIDVRDNNISDKGAAKLVKALRSNTTLVSFSVGDDDFTAERKAQIDRAIEWNISNAHWSHAHICQELSQAVSPEPGVVGLVAGYCDLFGWMKDAEKPAFNRATMASLFALERPRPEDKFEGDDDDDDEDDDEGDEPSVAQSKWNVHPLGRGQVIVLPSNPGPNTFMARVVAAVTADTAGQRADPAAAAVADAFIRAYEWAAERRTQ